MMQTPAGVPCYFASWTGYAPPIQPHNAIDYETAEASRAFSVFVFDEQGRAVSFEKWLASPTASARSALAGRTLPAGKIFFAPDRPGYAGPGRVLPLDETQGLAEYYRAHVHPDGAVAVFEHVRRQRMIRHDYRYWEGGRIREFRFESGGKRGVYEYDRDGNRVSAFVEGGEE